MKTPSRVAVLLDHAGHGDGRVKRAALAMRERGLNVRVFALIREKNIPKYGDLKTLDGTDIPLTPICMREGDMTPIPRWLIAILRPARRLFREQNSIERNAQDCPIVSVDPDNANSVRPSLIARINRTLGALFWHRALARAFRGELKRFQPHLLHSHDLSTLGAGVVLARKSGIGLIFDSHEFELGRNGVELNTAERIRQSFERVYVRHADIVITVSETIADRLQKIYRIDRPTVIPNITTAKPSDPPTLNKNRLGLNQKEPLVLYVGSLAPGRGLEMAIDAISILSRGILAVAGSGSETWRHDLMTYAAQAGAQDRFKILDPVPEDQVVDLLSLADVSIIPIQASCESYRLCLPNKMFQSLAAGTPIISTPLPEVAAIISKIEHCRVALDYSSRAFASALNSALDDCDHSEVSMPEDFQPGFLLARYKLLSEALIVDQPLPTFTPLKHASDAIAAATGETLWKPAKAPFSLATARAIALATSLESRLWWSNRPQKLGES